jgi:tetratricopeptide (TPR) repeat protein
MHTARRKGLAAVLAVLAALAAGVLPGQHEHPPVPEHGPGSPLKLALELIREGRTEAARAELNRLLAAQPDSAEIYYQIARCYLFDLHAGRDPVKKQTALGLALEALDNVLRRDGNHIPALKAKAVIHARAELLRYDPNLAYELAARVAKLQPSASEYLIGLTDWLSGEVRFTTDTEHRVPHDPLTGIDRSIEILHRVLDITVPFSSEETAGLYQMGKTLAKRRNFAESIRYFQLALERNVPVQQRAEILREIGASHYRAGQYIEAARAFYRAMEALPNAVDAWLLRVSVDQSGQKDFAIPSGMDFPLAEAAPAPASLSFRDAAREFGVNRFDGNGTCAFGDIDGDGREDLLLAGSGTFLGAYRNEGDRFREVTEQFGLAGVPSGYSLNLIDYDNDGRLDLYMAMNGWNGPMPNRLYRNASGRFVAVPKAGGADDPGSGFVSVWGDLDNDGFIDLVVANGVLKDGSTPQVYRNRGDGTFVNVTLAAGIKEPPTHGTIGAALGDYDRDGDLDIFFNGLVNSPNRLYRNDGGMRFTDVSRASGVAAQPLHNGFVAFFTDYNNDGWPDLLVTSLAPWDAVVGGLMKTFRTPDRGALHADSTRLFRNRRDGTFQDVTAEAGLGYPMGVMGAGVADLDNDGHVDFYFGTGDPQLSRIEPNRWFHNEGNGTFRDVTRWLNLSQPGKKGHGVCFTDIDRDGDLELYAQLGGHYSGDHAENAFYRNLKGSDNNWLQVELEGVKSNRFGIGATVVVTAGDLTQSREMKGSEGFGATSAYLLHFGLGRRSKIDSVEVRWPGGRAQRIDPPKINSRIRVKEN